MRESLKTGRTAKKVARPRSKPVFKRRELPQIRAGEIGAFVRTLRAQNIKVEAGKIALELLDPVQEEITQAKVAAKAKAFAGSRTPIKPFIVSSDGYIIDGHHQWAALKRVQPGQLVNILLVHLEIEELVAQAKSFEQAKRKKVERPSTRPQICPFLPKKR